MALTDYGGEFACTEQSREGPAVISEYIRFGNEHALDGCWH
jgi:hypothetical protein